MPVVVDFSVWPHLSILSPDGWNEMVPSAEINECEKGRGFEGIDVGVVEQHEKSCEHVVAAGDQMHF